jgi:putative tryptophan/tyrosine transport system substrate-binding protein
MRRRDFIAGLVVAATTGSAWAQQPGKVYRIAIVDPSNSVADLTETGSIPAMRAFFEALRRLGYVEGQNLLVERYSGEGRTEHFAELARDVVRRNPELILGTSSRLVLDFKAATTTIPIVGMMGDPVLWGIVPSLARPGGNITGVSTDAGPKIWGKRLALLKEAVPRMSRVGFLASGRVWEAGYGAVMREAASTAGASLVAPQLDAPFGETDLRRVFAAMAQEGADALVVSDQGENFTYRKLIVELAEKGRLPAIYPYGGFVQDGGLMAYSLDLLDMGRRAADQINQILKGTKPGEIPIYQPTKYALSINLKTAKALGIEMPSSLLAQADEVIE